MTKDEFKARYADVNPDLADDDYAREMILSFRKLMTNKKLSVTERDCLIWTYNIIAGDSPHFKVVKR